MATNPNMLVADDPRNPSYYERLAGYPKLTQEWYYGDKTREEWQLPVYTKERFVTGFDISTGQFYELRRKVTKHMLRNEYHKDDLGSEDFQFNLAEMYAMFLKVVDNKVLDQDGRKVSRLAFLKIPALWKRMVMHEFITDTVRAIQDNRITLKDDKLDQNYPVEWTWEWGPDRERPDFDGYFQLQHLIIVIKVPNDECDIKVWDIQTTDRTEKTSVDIAMEHISFAKLQTALAKADNSPYNPEEYSLVYQHPDLEDKAVEVVDDATFHSAIQALHTRMSDEIMLNMMLVANLGVN